MPPAQHAAGLLGLADAGLRVDAAVCPHYVTMVEEKGRTTRELHEVIEWLTWAGGRRLRDPCRYFLPFAVVALTAPLP